MRHLSVFLRAIVGGFLVSSTGIAIWSAALSFIPAPWSVLAMMPALWLFWAFFNGRRGPQWDALNRKENFRLTRLPTRVWQWGLAGALLFVVIVQASFVITFRLLPFPAGAFTAEYKALDRMPLWEAWCILVMSAIVAGVCEETGFRGYMQRPLEKRYGAAAAIVVTSLIFMLIHLNHAWARVIWPQIFFASVLLGILAYRSGSLIPGIIGHSILDVFDYSLWWTDLTGGFTRLPVSLTGVDGHFVGWVLIFLLGLAAFGFVMLRLTRDPAAMMYLRKP